MTISVAVALINGVEEAGQQRLMVHQLQHKLGQSGSQD